MSFFSENFIDIQIKNENFNVLKLFSNLFKFKKIDETKYEIKKFCNPHVGRVPQCPGLSNVKSQNSFTI